MNLARNSRPLAVVTGASSGIGFELARVFGEEGFDLLIAAQDEELDSACRELNQMTASVEATRVDLSRAEGVERLHERIRATDRPVAALCLNAGRGAGGGFASETRLEDELEIVDLNVRSTVHLAKLELPAMVDRGEGRILFTSSVAATMPGAFQAVYNASKSFVQSFALALRNELQDTGVSVTSLMPGATETEFFAVAEMEDTKVGAAEKDDPAEVARQGYEALMAGEERVVGGGLENKMRVAAGKVLPDSKKAEMHREMAEPGSARKG